MTNNNGLPQNWDWIPLGEAVEDVVKVQPKENPEEEFIYLDISSIDNTQSKIVSPKYYLGKDAPSRARQLVKVGDILFSTVRTYLKNIAQVPPIYDDQIASTGFCVIRPKPPLNKDFYFYLALTDQFINPLSKIQRGTSYPAVRNSDVLEQFVPVPPVPEQERIVAKIEELFTQLDVGVAELQQAKAQLQRYRQAVLKFAVEGELTREWREAHQSELEPAERLLARILAERRVKWEVEELAKLRTKGKEPKNDKWKAKYKEPALPEVDGLPDVPDGWVWASVEQLSAHEPNSITDGPFGSKLKTAHYTDKGPRVIRLQNIGNGVFYNEKAHISEKHFETLRKHEILAGDLVIGALGATLPRSCIIPDFVGPAIVKADCMRFKPLVEIGDVRYLNAALNSQVLKNNAASIIHGIGRPRLNQGEVKSLQIPLPPMEEQKVIAAKVERRLSVADEIEKELDQALARSERLRQSILKRAFEGRLVGQEDGDGSDG